MPKIQYEKILPSAHNLYIHNFVVSLLYIYFLRKSMLFLSHLSLNYLQRAHDMIACNKY